MHISQYKSNKINPKSKIPRSKIFIILKNTRREEDKRSPPCSTVRSTIRGKTPVGTSAPRSATPCDYTIPTRRRSITETDIHPHHIPQNSTALITNHNHPVQISREQQPCHIRHKEPCSLTARAKADIQIPSHEKIEDNNIDEPRHRTAQDKEQHAPCKIHEQLSRPYQHHPLVHTLQNTTQRNTHKNINDTPCDRKHNRRRSKRRFDQTRVPHP